MERLRFTPEARLDILDARSWYEERAPGLGMEFARAVDVAASAILRFPQAFPEVHAPIRKAVMRRFPYALLFVIEGERILVVGCFHQRRDPQAWVVRC
ncbi:MAG TPA: type II toxin-antitoxin system RelE/ParE family toxin [Longimicrobiales bacterium]|nr:type II toxin-antitoxin system RelE/ParE family toxin [Longimicrobiales bacterium]